MFECLAVEESYYVDYILIQRKPEASEICIDIGECFRPGDGLCLLTCTRFTCYFVKAFSRNLLIGMVQDFLSKFYVYFR